MYSTVVKLVTEEAFSEIALKSAYLIREAKLEPYSQLDVVSLSKRVMPVLAIEVRYLESGDLSEWKAYCVNLTQERGGEGVAFTQIIEAGRCIIQALTGFFETTIPTLGTVDGLSADKVLTNIKRRLQGLFTVGVTTVTATGIKQKKVH